MNTLASNDTIEPERVWILGKGDGVRLSQMVKRAMTAIVKPQLSGSESIRFAYDGSGSFMTNADQAALVAKHIAEAAADCGMSRREDAGAVWFAAPTFVERLDDGTDRAHAVVVMLTSSRDGDQVNLEVTVEDDFNLDCALARQLPFTWTVEECSQGCDGPAVNRIRLAPTS